MRSALAPAGLDDTCPVCSRKQAWRAVAAWLDGGGGDKQILSDQRTGVASRVDKMLNDETSVPAPISFIADVLRGLCGGPAPIRPSLGLSSFLEASASNHCSICDAPFVAISSSGTTGSPRTIVHSRSSLCRPIEFLADDLGRGASGAAQVVAFDLSSIGGLVATLVGLLTGYDVVAIRPSQAAVSDIRTWPDCTELVSIPSALAPYLVASRANAALRDLPLARVSIGGSLTTQSLLVSLAEAAGAMVVEGYGMTEVAGPVMIRSSLDPVFRPMPGVTVEVVSPGGSSRTSGELQVAVASPAIAVLDQRSGSSIRLASGAPISTGDLATVSADGTVELRGRADLAIVRGSVSISPEAVEFAVVEVIGRPVQVAAAGYVHRGREKLVVLVAGSNDPALARQIREGLAAPYRPNQVLFVDRLPLAGSAKVDRAEVGRMLAAMGIGDDGR